jgi:hypothetical protein
MPEPGIVGCLEASNSAERRLPHLGPTGAPTTLHDTIFSTIAGAPAYVGKAPKFKMTNTGLGVDIDIQNHNAMQGSFLFEG